MGAKLAQHSYDRESSASSRAWLCLRGRRRNGPPPGGAPLDFGFGRSYRRRKGLETHGGSQMPTLHQFDGTDLRAVVHYLQTLR